MSDHPPRPPQSTFPSQNRVIALAFGILLAARLSLFAVTSPYTNDFTTDPSGVFTLSNSYSLTGSGSIGWDSGTGTYLSHVADVDYGGVDINWATVNTSNLNAASDNFTISGTFIAAPSINDLNGSSSVGLGVSVGVNFPIWSVGAEFYYGTICIHNTLSSGASVGELNIVKSDSAWGSSIASSTPILASYTPGTLYTMTFSGTYSGSNLTLNFSVTDGANSQSASANISNAYTSLTNFGFQHQNTNWTENEVYFDNFSINAVPEPSVCTILVMGVIGLASRVRGKHQTRCSKSGSTLRWPVPPGSTLPDRFDADAFSRAAAHRYSTQSEFGHCSSCCSHEL